MKKSEFKEFVKEMFIDLIQSDEEVRDIVLEFVQENSNVLTEAIQPDVPKEPEDTKLYDKLVMVAAGNTGKFSHNGKLFETPNYGVGLKDKDSIVEWANKKYSLAGGKWVSVNQRRQADQDSINALTGMFGVEGSVNQFAHYGNNDNALKEAIRASVGTQNFRDGDLNPIDGGQATIMEEILADTARNTLPSFPSSHPGPDEGGGAAYAGAMSAAAQRESVGDLDQTFGDSVGNWSHLAFQGVEQG